MTFKEYSSIVPDLLIKLLNRSVNRTARLGRSVTHGILCESGHVMGNARKPIEEMVAAGWGLLKWRKLTRVGVSSDALSRLFRESPGSTTQNR
jgi:hypothetical protein